MRKIRNLRDVVEWGLCTGCGACFFFCREGSISLVDIDSVGIRPRFNKEVCDDYIECLSICPGFRVVSNAAPISRQDYSNSSTLIGPTLEIWEGYARDEEIRHFGSSGGVLTALALYCIEKEDMDFVLHTGMNTLKPWLNKTKVSRTRADLLKSAGSRYATSSPCDFLELIERNDKPCVFIGKPCDVMAVQMIRTKRPKLDKNLGLVLTMFCAGTPSTKGTLELLRKLHINERSVQTIRYRGEGWPGNFKVRYDRGEEKTLTYEESWGELQKYRPFRCHLCPDALGESADISSGDAWNSYSEDINRGLSLVLVRTQKGLAMLHEARANGYVHLNISNSSQVVKGQPVIERRKQLFGRLLAMRLLLIPTPKYSGYHLYRSWMHTSLAGKLRTVLGTSRRIIRRCLWHRNSLFQTDIPQT